jgi:L-alanine-DL-glutamate epimerase-like enolase superfamily enzyme
MNPLESLLRQRVIPFFLGKDARDLESLVEEVFLTGSNYKYGGLAFWCCVGYVEIALFDLLARQADVRVGELLGAMLRDSIPVYLSRFNRDNSAREEVAEVGRALKQYGAGAVKLKVGRRMFSTPEQSRRDVAMVKLARETLGPSVTLLVDANGSWTAEEALAFDRETADVKLGFIEEPCRWQDYQGTRRVAQDIETPVAAGEQDTAFEQFTWMATQTKVQYLQPDLVYNGGFIRSLRVARLAAEAGRRFTPHSPKTGFGAAANLHLVSVVPNLGPFQEYREAGEVVNGRVAVPPGPGLDGRLELAPFRQAEPV